jgi:transglutaminase-like putative cysteine protease
MFRAKAGWLLLLGVAVPAFAAANLSHLTPLKVPTGAAAARPSGYRLWYQPVRQVQCTFTDTTTISGASVKEWIFWECSPPKESRQDLKMVLTPGGEAGFTKAPDKRPLEFFRRIEPQPQSPSSCSYKLVYTGWLAEISLRPLLAGQLKPLVAALPAAQRTMYTAATDVYNYHDPVVQAWLNQGNLHKAAGESELDFAKRVFMNMRKNFKYDFAHGSDNTASLVVRDHAGVCGGLSIAFASALRASGVPARSLSLKNCAGDGSGDGNYMGHANNEFYCGGIGWVPADLTGGITAQNDARAMTFFGHDYGENIVQFDDDTAVSVDTVQFGAAQPQPSASYRSQYSPGEPNTVTGRWFGLDAVYNGNAQWKPTDTYAQRQWTDPRAYEGVNPTGPAANIANTAGFNVWQDNRGWHVVALNEGKSHNYTIEVRAENGPNPMSSTDPNNDQAIVEAGYQGANGYQSDFVPPPGAKALRFDLEVDFVPQAGCVFIGSGGAHPKRCPFTMPIRTARPILTPEKMSTQGQPAAPAQPTAGFDVWQDNAGWHVLTTNDGQSHNYQIEIDALGVAPGTPSLVAFGDQGTACYQLDFQAPAGATGLHFDLQVDYVYRTNDVFIGSGGAHPLHVPFILPPK